MSVNNDGEPEGRDEALISVLTVLTVPTVLTVLTVTVLLVAMSSSV